MSSSTNRAGHLRVSGLLLGLHLVAAGCASPTNGTSSAGVDARTATLAAEAATPAEHVAVARAYGQRADELSAAADRWEQEVRTSSIAPALLTKNPALRTEREREERRVFEARQRAAALRARAQWHFNEAIAVVVAPPG